MSETTASAAKRLNTSAPTVRKLLEEAVLRGIKVQRGSRFTWAVESESVDEFLSNHGEFGTRSPARLSASEIASRLEAMETAIGDLSTHTPGSAGDSGLAALQLAVEQLIEVQIALVESARAVALVARSIGKSPD